MRWRLMLMFASLVLVGAADARAQDVRYNFDKEADFSRFKTYQWVELKDARVVNELADMQIRAAVDAELAAKGLTRVESEGDLFVGYQAAVNTEKQYTSYDTGWGYGPGWYGGGWYGGGGMTTTTGQTSTIYIGQLALDVYNASSRTLIWRGVASKTIDPKAKPDKQQKNLSKAMTKLLKNFPPPPPKR